MHYLLIVLASCTSLAEGIIIKKYNGKYQSGSFIFTAMISFFSMSFFLLSDLITDPQKLTFPAELLPYALVAGVWYCAATILTYIALQIGSFVISLLIISYSIVFTTAYGIIFLDEPTTLFTWLGFALIAISLFLLRRKSDESSEKKKFSFTWLICIAVSCVGNGAFAIISRMQQIRFDNGVTNEFMVIALTLSAVTLGIFGIVKEKKQAWGSFKTCLPYAIGAGMSNGMTNMMSMFVNTLIPISIAAPTRSAVKNILSMGVSMAIFKEKFLPRQIVGVVLGAVAVVLLNL